MTPMPDAANAVDDPQRMRRADAPLLARALTRGRRQLLALFDAYRQSLGTNDLRVPHSTELNLPLWELGHIGWFEEYWLARFGARTHGAGADPAAPRIASLRSDADALYDSSHVPHAARWQLALPSVDDTRRYLHGVRDRTLALLQGAGSDDDALYFFRLVLFHEDMHREAWIYSAQNLGIALGDAIDAQAPAPVTAGGEWALPRRGETIGCGDAGFAFDNERLQQAVDLGECSIDRACVSWQRYLPFVECGAHDERRWWSTAGWQWKQQQRGAAPRYLRRRDGQWQRQQFGRWQALDSQQPAMNLSFHEAEAWCRWAGRRLPSEAEWESAARRAGAQREVFEWGQVWEWTASRFVPYAGFVAHPYRDYSQPWFDGRPVLRGASFATAARMKHPAYRNYFGAERNDIFAGFRSCSA
jgi:gamma-glutamyl hercynylcysteine S-oxide synthase